MLHGHCRGRIVLAMQETTWFLPSLVVELSLQTYVLLYELRNPADVRIILETQCNSPMLVNELNMASCASLSFKHN